MITNAALPITPKRGKSEKPIRRERVISVLVIVIWGILLASSIPVDIVEADVPSYTVVDTIPAAGVGQMALNHDGSKLYGACHLDCDQPNILVIDTQTEEITATIPLGFGGYICGIAVTPDGSRVYVPVARIACGQTLDSPSRVEVIDTATNAIIKTILTGGGAYGPTDLVITPDGSWVYVSHHGDNKIHIISTVTNTIVGSVSVAGQPVGIAVTPDGSRVYTAPRLLRSISVIDTSTNSVIATVPISIGPNVSGTSIAITPDGGRAYVSHEYQTSVAAIDTDPASPTYHQQVGIIPTTSGYVFEVALTPDSRVAFVTNGSSGNDGLSILDIDPTSHTYHTQVNALLPGTLTSSVVSTNSPRVVAYVSHYSGSVIWAIGVPNVPPEANADGPYISDESAAVTFDGSDSLDLDEDSLLYRWDFENDGIWNTEWLTDPTVTHTYFDDWSGIVKLEVSDGEFTDTDTAVVTISNLAPTVEEITAPIAPVEVNTAVSVSGNFSDPGILDIHTAIWDWGDDNTSEGTVDETGGSGSVVGSYTYTTAGVYTVKLTVTDDDGDSGDSIFQYVVIYDPGGGFVTGGGWIDSPEGAYVPDPSLTGKANFGFVSKYKKGATVPTGQTEFNFKVASMNFHSSSYEWLVVANHKAKYKGVGTINGDGNYGFMLSAIDEELTPSTDVDLFRIKIWDKDNNDSIVYDNQMDAEDDADATTEIGGGNIKIHDGGNASPVHPDLTFRSANVPLDIPKVFRLLPNYPNPFNPETWLPYELAAETAVFIRIYNANGQLVRQLDLGHQQAGSYLDRDEAAYWDGKDEIGQAVSSGVYFYQIKAGDFNAVRKMTIVK